MIFVGVSNMATLDIKKLQDPPLTDLKYSYLMMLKCIPTFKRIRLCYNCKVNKHLLVISLNRSRLLEKIFSKHWGYIKIFVSFNKTLLFSNIRYNHLLLLHGQQPSKTQYFCFRASVLLQIKFCPALWGLNIFTWFLSHPPLWIWLDDQNECDRTTRH